jgi:hypothetical protein
MGMTLTLHPDSRCAAVSRIDVEATRPLPGTLVLRYAVTGKMDDLAMPPVAAPTRADGLWRRTCFEAFVGAPPAAAYYEFNVAPSRQWAAYRFAGYRRDMRDLNRMDAPQIEVESSVDACTLQAAFTLDGLAGLPGDVPWRLGLSAVIEEAGGRISHWALAHPPGQADFHHPDGFVVTL